MARRVSRPYGAGPSPAPSLSTNSLRTTDTLRTAKSESGLSFIGRPARPVHARVHQALAESDLGSRYMGADGNFVPVASNHAAILRPTSQKCVQTVADGPVQAVELASFLVDEDAVAAECRQQAGRKRCVNPFEELEETRQIGKPLPSSR
jgi:hypothetical protein